MMRSIIGWSLRARFHVVGLAAVIMIVGIWQLRGAKVDILPEFMPPYVEVQTEALGLSAEEVEQFITVPLEADLLNGVAWLHTIRSESVPGLSSIQLVFEPGTDVMRARQMVQERLTQGLDALPKVSRPPAMLQPLSSMNRVMMIGLSSKSKLSLIDISVLARWTIKPRLMGVPGVANVSIWGQRERQLQVQVEPERLRKQDVLLGDVIATTGNALWVSPLTFLNASTPGTGGFIDTPNQRLEIRHVSPIVTPEHLAQVPIKTRKGKVLRLGEVANVVEDHQPLIGDAVINHESGLLLVVEKFPWANTRDVTKGLDAALQALQPGLSGVVIDASIFRPSTFIQAAMNNLAVALGLGCLLIALVLAVCFREWRSALISLVAIGASVVAAGFVLYLRGVTINIMVLTGLVIALAVIVDDAVAGIENVRRRLRQRYEENGAESTAAIVLDASLEVRRPMLYATLIMALGLVPVFLIERLSAQGASGEFLPPVALAFGLAVLASMLVALTLTPALALILMARERATHGESPLLRPFQLAYERLLSKIVERPRIVWLGVGGLAIIGLAILPALHLSLLPKLKETDLLIHWDSKPGTSLPEMRRVTSQATRELRALPGVRNVGAHVGRAVMSDQVVGINSAELWVSIDPAAHYDKTVAAVQKVIEGYPGFYRDVRTHSQTRMNKIQSRQRDAVIVRVYGDNLAELRTQADDVRRALTGVGGISALRVARDSEEPTVEIEVKLAAARRYGIKPGDVRRAAATLVAGIEVGSLFEEQKVFEVVVLGEPSTRHSLTSIGDLLLDGHDGEQVRLRDVAELRVTPNPAVIKRDAVSRYVDVEAAVSGRSLGAVAQDIEHRLAALKFPLGYRAELVGEYSEHRVGLARILGYTAAAVLGIFLLLQAALSSWRVAGLCFITLLIAIVGGLLVVLAGGGVISLGALVGLFAVVAITARNGLMLLNHFRHLERYEGESLGPALVLRGARERFAPMMTTALATGLAVVPLAVFGNIPGLEIEHPMAVVVLGGLVTSMLLTLLAIPTLYLRLAAAHNPVADVQV